ncbi:MAG: hypothetical protein IH616_17970 [Gemmatimonadales bacterium]|nr:hypothetical protein [Gemmatimonadales bacterium]
MITADFDRVVAIDVLGSLNRTLEEGDTLTLQARAISAAGEVVPDAPVVWEVIDTGTVGFVLDGPSGFVTGVEPGSGRAQARYEDLRAGPVTLTIHAAPDSMAAAGDTALVVDTTATASPPLAVLVFDLTTEPGMDLALAGSAVHFLTVDPAPGTPPADGFFLALPTQTAPGEDPHALAATTGSTGEASIVVRRQSGVTQPDSAVIHAVVVTATGDTVAGSPVRFHVRFLN